jgi:hypothetical protein
VTPSVDHAPPRRPLFFPVVIATVFLTIIGMAGGYLLGERDRQAGGPSTGSSRPVTPVVASSPTAVAGPLCPKAAQQAAAAVNSGSLRQIFRIRTTNSSTVWICQDPSGRLFYQSHTLLDGQDRPLQQNRNGLFLSGVHRTADGFQVYDQYSNRFEINRRQFQIYFVSGKVQSNPVAEVDD